MNVSNSRLSGALVLLMAGIALAGCKSKGQLVLEEGVGVTAVRTACPSVGIPDYTGDVTLFNGSATTADAIDLTATMTNVRTDCNPDGERVLANVRFEVQARRSTTRGARRVTLPWFVTVMRGGNAVIAKRIGSVNIDFADGQDRAQATATGSVSIDKAEATLSREIRDRITKKRKAGDYDAAIDPLAQPEVRTAVARATFDVFVGFQLTDAQLTYNATR